MNKKDKILIICGNLIKHKYFAIKLLKKFKNSNVIFENYPKKISHNYTPHRSKILTEHFKKVKFYEEKYFKRFYKKNNKFLKKRTLFKIKKGSINSEKVLRNIKKISPNTLSSGDGAIISYEQFRLYTLSLPFYQPFDDKSLGIDEKDIFIRYAINMGVQEILFFIMEKIFSPTYTIDR